MLKQIEKNPSWKYLGKNGIYDEYLVPIRERKERKKDEYTLEDLDEELLSDCNDMEFP